VILADTSIWIEHFRHSNIQLQKLLDSGQVLMHPLVVAELALGSLGHRAKMLAELDAILQVPVLPLSAVRHLIEARQLYSKGIGLTDAHLVGSCLITPGTRLWTRDAALRGVAQALGIDAGFR
jgi:predicted nucleic acid-binding protein